MKKSKSIQLIALVMVVMLALVACSKNGGQPAGNDSEGEKKFNNQEREYCYKYSDDIFLEIGLGMGDICGTQKIRKIIEIIKKIESEEC